jgi:hypothetical protein
METIDINFLECTILANDAIDALVATGHLLDYAKKNYLQHGRGYIHFMFDSKDHVRDFLQKFKQISSVIKIYYVHSGIEKIGNESLCQFVKEYDTDCEYVIAVSIKCPTGNDPTNCAIFPVKMERVDSK